jgi:ankyrin repeat protein
MKPIQRLKTLVFFLVILAGVPPVIQAQQKNPENQVKTVDMGSYKVSIPPGGGWKITVEKDKGHVLLEKKQMGFLRKVTGLSQDATIDVFEIKLMPVSWSLGEEPLVSLLDKEFMEVQGGSGKLVNIENSQATLKDKKFYILDFTIKPFNTDEADWTCDYYLYFPPQYKKGHAVYSFVYAHAQTTMAAMVGKMKLNPLFSVIDSFQIVDPLASIGGDAGELLRAAADGNNETIVGLLDKGVDINTATPQGTALGLASLFGHRETVDLLIEKGAEINKPDADAGVTPLSCAIMGGEPELAGHLIEKGVEIRSKTKAGFTALTFATATGQEGLSQTLIEKGADVNAKTADGQTPLNFSAATGQIRVAARLIEAGAEINAQTAEGWTPLMVAIQEQHFDVANLLIDKGAEVNKQRPDGWAAIFCAVDAGSLDLVKTLVEKGADINAQTKESKRTPLIEAVIASQPEIARFLIEKGVNVNVKTKEGFTALKVAKAKKLDDIVDLLKKAGAK